jgi:hypothetical protein
MLIYKAEYILLYPAKQAAIEQANWSECALPKTALADGTILFSAPLGSPRPYVGSGGGRAGKSQLNTLLLLTKVKSYARFLHC